MQVNTFYKLPKALIAKPLREKLSDSAIVLYSYLLNLNELSKKNGEQFQDENGQPYVVCPISRVMELLNCSNNKAERVFTQLENENLIIKKRQGQGRTSLIYVNNITYTENALDLCKNDTSRNAENALLEMPKMHTIKNYHNKTYNIKTNLSIGYDETIDLVRNQIEYDVLSQRSYGEVIDEIVSLLADTMSLTADTVRINKINIPIDKVRLRLKQLTAEHIEYVIHTLESNTSKIKNMRAYLLTALYNSIDTMTADALYGN